MHPHHLQLPLLVQIWDLLGARQEVSLHKDLQVNCVTYPSIWSSTLLPHRPQNLRHKECLELGFSPVQNVRQSCSNGRQRKRKKLRRKRREKWKERKRRREKKVQKQRAEQRAKKQKREQNWRRRKQRRDVYELKKRCVPKAIAPSTIKKTKVASNAPGDPATAGEPSTLLTSSPEAETSSKPNRQRKADHEEGGDSLDENQCCVCFQTYEEDVVKDTGLDWLQCACKRWLHDADGNDLLRPFCCV